VRQLPPPQIVIALRALRDESVARAVMVAALMAFRRSPHFSNFVSEMLTGLQSVFEGPPSRETASLEEPAAEPCP
jgi:hypothetical protein